LIDAVMKTHLINSFLEFVIRKINKIKQEGISSVDEEVDEE